MIIQLENATYSVSIDTLGAELKSFDNRLDKTKYLFNGDPVWWNGTAPVLFPIIGGLNGGSYRHDGKSYQLGSHGFARKSEFSVLERTTDKAVVQLRSDSKTLEQYPFNFSLTITFSLEYAGMSVRYAVRNIDKSTLYFSIGSHPAFNVPFAGGSMENYFVEFDQPEVDSRFFFLDGCVSLEAEPVFNNSRQLFLTPNTFDRGPIILKNVASRMVSIRKSRSPHAIKLSFDAPNVAIWSKPNRAPFVCIEPWWGIPDPVGFSESFDKKPGILPLAPQEVFTTRYILEVQ